MTHSAIHTLSLEDLEAVRAEVLDWEDTSYSPAGPRLRRLALEIFEDWGDVQLDHVSRYVWRELAERYADLLSLKEASWQ